MPKNKSVHHVLSLSVFLSHQCCHCSNRRITMLGAQWCVRTVTGVGAVTDQANACRPISNSTSQYSSYLQLSFQLKLKRRSKSLVICCNNSYRGSFGRRSDSSEHESNDDYIEASVLMSGSALK